MDRKDTLCEPISCYLWRGKKGLVSANRSLMNNVDIVKSLPLCILSKYNLKISQRRCLVFSAR